MGIERSPLYFCICCEKSLQKLTVEKLLPLDLMDERSSKERKFFLQISYKAKPCF